MTSAFDLPNAFDLLGSTLLHFVWQGAAIAVLLYIALAFTRRAVLRYNLALAALLLMAVSPIATFFWLQRGFEPAATPMPIQQAWDAMQTLSNSPALSTSVNSLASIDWLKCAVWVWFAGVLIFGIRALGGWVFLERLRGEKAQPIAEHLQRRCKALERRLGLNRTVRYLESHRIDSPAVVGWFRPVILLPITALTGLGPEQLEAVIAHELAHIKRLDCFVNLFQIAIETALFYHPAVWWASRTIRRERESCCDDIAVRICGDACTYARALTLMETWRTTPALVLAANSGSLKSRISRLLGLETITHSVPRAGLGAIGILCAAGALLAGANFNINFATAADSGFAAQASEVATVPVQSSADETAQVPSPAPPPVPDAPARPTHPETHIARVAPPLPEAPQQQPAPPPLPTEPTGNESYVDGIRSAGLTNITVDELIALKVHGVTPEYIRKVRSEWGDVSVHEIIAMKAQGIDASEAAQYRQLGLKDLSLHQLIALKAVGATPDYIRAMQAAGLSNLSAHEYSSAKAVGVTPDYVRAMQSAGFSHLSMHEYVSAKAMGITPEFIQKVHSHGFNNLSMRQLVALKAAGVF